MISPLSSLGRRAAALQYDELAQRYTERVGDRRQIVEVWFRLGPFEVANRDVTDPELLPEVALAQASATACQEDLLADPDVE